MLPPSLWHETLAAPATTDGPLPGPTDADVVIVGAGYTGLWTAWFLAEADPMLRIVVLDAATVGFGASGRNGGWCSGLLPTGLGTLARRHGRGAAVAMQSALFDAVDDIGTITAAAGIDCHYERGGYAMLARNSAQVKRVHAHLREAASFGFGEEHHRWLGAREAKALVAATDVLGAAFTPHCAALHPARLAVGLADAVREHGVRIHDDTRVSRIDPATGGGSASVRTSRGTVRAPVVLLATEGYTRSIRGHERDLLPVYSMMIATEPLPAATWDAIGLTARTTFNDARHLVIYGQRTEDGRMAFGGRGAPYHFGSSVDARHDVDAAVHAAIARTLVELFPLLAGTRVSHRWGGPLGIPRDWEPSVVFDRFTGLGRAGGYVGDGVATSHLAGRTLADLVLGRDSHLVRLPWVGHRSRRWEPEPLRWLAVNGALRLPSSIDTAEAAGRRSPRLRSAALRVLTGH